MTAPGQQSADLKKEFLPAYFAGLYDEVKLLRNTTQPAERARRPDAMEDFRNFLLYLKHIVPALQAKAERNPEFAEALRFLSAFPAAETRGHRPRLLPRRRMRQI